MEILKKVTELKAALDSLRPLDPDREAVLMQKLRLDWNYHSNHLEGNSLTFGETKALILFGITAAGKPLKDHFEMTGHDEAVKWVTDVVKEGRPLTENFIRELHQLILKEPYELPTITPEGIPAKRVIHVGVYKTSPNHVLTPTGEIFRFATPEATPAMMHDLIIWYREKEADPETHPLLMAAEFHYKFIRIHPFDDGNGRSARILMNFILMKHGYPPVVIKTEDKSNYIAALQQSDAGMITPFIEYIGQNLERSLDLMLRGARGENIDEADDVDKEIALIEQKLSWIKDLPSESYSLENITSIYDNSIKRLFFEFLSSCNKFDKFYEANAASLLIDGNGEWIDRKDKNELEIFKDKLISKVPIAQRIALNYNYSKFNGNGIPFFNHLATVTVYFEKYTYRIKNNGLILSKPYVGTLKDEEIQDVIRAETKAHTDFINQQIEKAQQKTDQP